MGYCDECKLEKTCGKTIGKMYGFCATDYKPKAAVALRERREKKLAALKSSDKK